MIWKKKIGYINVEKKINELFIDDFKLGKNLYKNVVINLSIVNYINVLDFVYVV